MFTRFELVSAYLYQRIYQARIQALRNKGITPDPDALQSLRQFGTTMDMRDPTRLKLPARTTRTLLPERRLLRLHFRLPRITHKGRPLGGCTGYS